MKKVFLDVPHNYGDPGAVANGMKEANLSLTIAQFIKETLKSYPMIQAKLLTDFIPLNSATMTLQKRCDVANEWQADVFISPHINAGGGKGFESYIHPSSSPKTTALQHIVHEEVLNKMRTFAMIKDRGKKNANFAVLRGTKMPALLTENLFIDGLDDSDLLKQHTFIQAIGQAHATAIATFLSAQQLPSSHDTEQEKAIQWAKAQGISNGEQLHKPLTRAQGIVMMYRALNK
ncbi:N-acetylmuramoyl-L-alanine amidase [Metabacillus iocasae]|uniref:N-acetylmuramoyl-L-alanine amidase n=1 Tax=Priestia iocasae TaxID=2291674 RepID=A0ABS2QT09_9BACI|nr:N-acetylmuramoyl-L-alanine amidase [Metabacillus iocasae]MBM7702318.1 N-acetylmuramoyl-L-alanine amidase [Metabacillus iocasae]